jgi:hypothetical protein
LVDGFEQEGGVARAAHVVYAEDVGVPTGGGEARDRQRPGISFS